MIPSGWSVALVRDLCTLESGNGFKPSDWKSSGLPIIRIQNLNGSKEFNYFQGHPEKRWLVEPGQILFAWAGVKGVSFGPKIWNGPRGVLNQHIFKVHPKPGVEKSWLHLALMDVTQRIEENAHGFKSSLLHVRRDDILDQEVGVPTPAEQARISKAVASWEVAISTTESLIAAKQQRKQAMMQQLLTGKKRLPGFKKPWQSIPFGEMYERVTRFVEMDDSTSYVQAIVKRWRAGIDVRNALDGDEIKTKNLQTIHAGDFVLSDIQAAYGAMCKVGPEHDGLYVSNLYTILRPIKGHGCVDYLDQFARTKHMLSLIEQSSNGVKAERLRINFQSKQLMQHEIPVPPDVKEQMAIAKVLMTADREISLLEAKRSALEMQKKALMAVLLTGKKRLKA